MDYPWYDAQPTSQMTTGLMQNTMENAGMLGTILCDTHLLGKEMAKT